MKSLALFLAFFPIIVLGQVEFKCPALLVTTVEVPEGFQASAGTKQALSFLGADFLAGRLRCYYGVGALFIDRPLDPKLKCQIKNPPKARYGAAGLRHCLGTVEQCTLTCF